MKRFSSCYSCFQNQGFWVIGVHYYDIAGYWVMVGGNKADMACLVEIVVVTDMVVAIMGEESWEVGKCE